MLQCARTRNTSQELPLAFLENYKCNLNIFHYYVFGDISLNRRKNLMKYKWTGLKITHP
jgi:hypothetical protein